MSRNGVPPTSPSFSETGNGLETASRFSPSRILIKLDFLKPFEAHNTADFTLQPQGNSTTVTWAMYGPQAFPMKVMGLFMSMDSMVGKDFQRGLANMKVVAEA